MANPGLFNDAKLSKGQQALVKNGLKYYGDYGDAWPPADLGALETILKNALDAGAHTTVAELRGLLKAARAAQTDAQKDFSATTQQLLDPKTAPLVQSRILGDANIEFLEIEYPAINRKLILPGTLITFEDRYKPKFTKEEVYGRMDPIVSYQNTSRSITLGWEVGLTDGDVEWAYAAMGDLAKLMYPVYQEANFNQLGTGTLVAAPLLRFSLPNSKKLLKNVEMNGILGAVDSFDYMKMSADQGKFDMIRQGHGLAGMIVPTKLLITISFTVLHEGAKVGWVWSKEADTKETINGVTTEIKGGDLLTFGQGRDYPYGMGSTIDNMTKGIPVADEGDQEPSVNLHNADDRTLNERARNLNTLLDQTGTGLG